MLKVIAASRAFVSAALLLLWLFRNSSPIEPSGESPNRAGIVKAGNFQFESLGQATVG